MEILVKIDSGHKPKSTNILPKTLGNFCQKNLDFLKGITHVKFIDEK